MEIWFWSQHELVKQLFLAICSYMFIARSPCYLSSTKQISEVDE